ncbi:MAG: glycosyltransferase [Ignavibacterium sp.]|nr:glycosyltransferase [Ignavibacterium sp.]
MSKISLSMIVKNEESTLNRCLDSVKDIVDEIIIVDTGSTDNTIEVAKSFNAKIFSFNWSDDFSSARNFALKNSSGDYILYLDADEILSSKSKKEVKDLTRINEKVGYICTITSIDDFSNQKNSIKYVRLFKNSENIEFRGKAHEQITESLIENGYKIKNSSVEIIHYGYNISKEEKKKKAERNLKLLLSDNSKLSDGYKYFQIGQSYFVLENFIEAEKFFNLALNTKNLSKYFRAESFFYISQIGHFNYDIDKSEKYILKAISINSNQPYYHYLYSKILQRKKQFNEALKSLIKSYNLSSSSSKIMSDNLQIVYINEYETLLNIIELSFKVNDFNNLKFYSNELIKYLDKSSSNKSKAFKEIFNSIFRKDLIINDKKLLTEVVDEHNLNVILSMIDKSFDHYNKKEIIYELHKKFPTNTELIKRLSLIYDSENNLTDAIKFLEDNSSLIEQDPACLFYLASFYIKSNELRKALVIFNKIEEKFPKVFELNSNSKEIKSKIEKLLERS